MKTTSRDKVLMMVLPSLIIFIGYGLLVARGQISQVNRLEEAVKKGKEQQPTKAQLSAQYAKKMQTQNELAKAEKDLKELKDRWQGVTGTGFQHENRSYRQSKLLVLLQGQKVHVKLHGPAENAQGQKGLKLSPPQERLVKLMAEGGQQAPHLCCLEVEGGYLDVARAISILSSTSGDLVAIPLSLSMQPHAKKSGVHTWSILVWI